MRATRLRYALAAAVLPVASTAYLLAVGYRLPVDVHSSGTLAVVAESVGEFYGAPVYVPSLAALGAGALAGVPVLLAAEFRLFSPAAVVSTGFAWAAFETLSELPKTGIVPSPVSMYGLAWFAPLAVALAAAGAERALRRRIPLPTDVTDSDR